MGVQKSFGEKSGNKGEEPNNGENERNRTEHPFSLSRQRWSPYGIDVCEVLNNVLVEG